jgi:non-ribosomal peptide synthetase component F
VPVERVWVDDDALDAAVDDAARTPIDVATTIPVRATLVRGPGRAALIVVVHHLAGDEWSLATLLDDLAAAHTARLAGRAPEFPPLPTTNARTTRAAAVRRGDPADPSSPAAAGLARWRDRLAGAPTEVTVAHDRPRPPRPSGAGGEVPVTIDAALHRGERALARETGTTTFMVVHAALTAVLRGLGVGEDVVVGTPVARREDPAAEPLVGLFVGLVALRVPTDGVSSVRELLGRVRDADLDAVGDAGVPFDEVVSALAPPRRPGRHPLFQVMLSHREVRPPSEVPHLAGHPVRTELRGTGTAKLDLTVELTETRGADGITGRLEYASELYDASTAWALVDALVAALRAMAADVDGPLPDLSDPAVPHEGNPHPHRATGASPRAPGADPSAAHEGNPRVDRATEGSPRAESAEATRALAAVFADVLGVASVDPDGDFFALGGDSIASIRVVARARAAGWAVEVADVLDLRTASALAAVARPEGAALERTSEAPARLVDLDDDELDDLGFDDDPADDEPADALRSGR